MLLGKLWSGQKVFSAEGSHIHPNTRKHLHAALDAIRAHSLWVKETVSFPEVLGHDICVTTDESDRILFAKQVARRGHTRFVRDRQPLSTNLLTVILTQNEDHPNCYTLVSTWLGPLAPPEPWDTRAFRRTPKPRTSFQESWSFWGNHALVWGYAETVPRSQVRYCPWPLTWVE